MSEADGLEAQPEEEECDEDNAVEEDEEEVDMDVTLQRVEDRKIVEGVRRVDWEVGVICYGIPAGRRCCKSSCLIVCSWSFVCLLFGYCMRMVVLMMINFRKFADRVGLVSSDSSIFPQQYFIFVSGDGTNNKNSLANESPQPRRYPDGVSATQFPPPVLKLHSG